MQWGITGGGGQGGQSLPPPVPLYPASRTFMALNDREAMFV